MHVQIVGKRRYDEYRAAIVVNGEFEDAVITSRTVAVTEAIGKRIADAVLEVKDGEIFDVQINITQPRVK